jgi:hypothetical protein
MRWRSGVEAVVEDVMGGSFLNRLLEPPVFRLELLKKLTVASVGKRQAQNPRRETIIAIAI